MADPHIGRRLTLGAGKTVSLTVLLLCQVLAMSVWFASSAAVSSIEQAVPLTAWQASLLTSSVQAGFVAGTIGSAVLGLADRFDPRRLIMVSALVAAGATLMLLACEPAGPAVYFLRFVTGMCMAGIYPVGMRLAATWAERDLGLLIGLLVGALTLGSASPHLLAAFGGMQWPQIYLASALLAAVAGLAINLCGVGPAMRRAARLNPAAVTLAWRHRPLRLANLGYLGHMWELYAMWTWLAVFLHESFTRAGVAAPDRAAEIMTFVALGSGALGAWAGGWFADRYGRTAVTIAAMAGSGTCALAMGWLMDAPSFVVGAVAIAWGITIVADSAQFSASIAELAPPDSIGTLLTAQTCAGFLLTLVSIHLLPAVQHAIGWAGAFGMLAAGPFFGCLAMLRLRRDPASRTLAHGKR
ncbi:MFS transporter [Bordetella genomosp. 9]|uniref:MFS transporter n=1 Tax=Bordetella genomosp. 9 TaxID=1416803 RepID=A0A1W6Z4J0_9BORD|nr:MFS transporter [Bordetella genomosp. 9]ARP88325.1 MFS transporter [Bordetella genomosp. 9]